MVGNAPADDHPRSAGTSTGELIVTEPLSPDLAWEQSLIDAYLDNYWRQVLQPLYDDFQRWHAGELTNDDLAQAIQRTYRQCQKVTDLRAHSPESLVGIIQFDDQWLVSWLKEHPKPTR
jgi:hypothetical protein